MVLTNVSSNVLKLWLVSDELFLGWNIDAHVTREPDWWRGNPDMDLSRRKYTPVIVIEGLLADIYRKIYLSLFLH